ncbi:nuclear transport factor 2 family protein [Acidovorax cavernicola]|uniref:Nuclear transport factor 2 family protein n=1 Tax=Acidovorax cavernicola TaxID=1675792 RepID=A0A9X8CXR1_9BURK|nr:nuclear transport factor 2 family protein [Acidovorax cavernicola]RIX69458.1 nuclear transport factor 2 family protein [Acidovorax cavernicola]
MSAPAQSGEIAVRAACLDLERRRQSALVALDLPALDQMFAADLVHIHSVGLVHDKAALLAHIEARRGFAAIERGPLEIRVLGDDAAVMTGAICNHMRAPDGSLSELRGMVTQIVRRTAAGWQFMHFQLTPLQ